MGVNDYYGDRYSDDLKFFGPSDYSREVADYLGQTSEGQTLRGTFYSKPAESVLKRYSIDPSNIEGVIRRQTQRNQGSNEFGRVTNFLPNEDIHFKSYQASGSPDALMVTGNVSLGAMVPISGSFPRTPEDRRNLMQRYGVSSDGAIQANYGVRITGRIKQDFLKMQEALISYGRGGTKPPERIGGFSLAGTATSDLVQSIAQARKGDEVTVASPYLQHKGLQTALIEAHNRGVRTKVIFGSALSNTRAEPNFFDHAAGAWNNLVSAIDSKLPLGLSRLKISQGVVKDKAEYNRILYADALAAAGVNVYGSDETLLAHLKGAYVKYNSRATSKGSPVREFSGSGNFTDKSSQGGQEIGGTLDVFLQTYGYDSGLPKLFASLLDPKSKDYLGLTRQSKPRYLRATKYDFGQFSDIYRRSSTFIGNEGLLYLPTQYDNDFFRNYPGARTRLYQDTAYTFMGREPRGLQRYALQRMDREMSSGDYTQIPILGDVLNLSGVSSAVSGLMGTMMPFYKPGDGILTSALRALGRGLDTVTGFYAMQQYRDYQQGKLYGGLSRHYGQEYRSEPSRGFFETSLVFGSQTVGSLATGLAAYFGVSHAYNLLVAHAEETGTAYLGEVLSKAQMGSGVMAKDAYKVWTRSMFSKDAIDVILTAGLGHPQGRHLGESVEALYDYVVLQGFQGSKHATNGAFSEILQNNQFGRSKAIQDLLSETGPEAVNDILQTSRDSGFLNRMINRVTEELNASTSKDLSRGLEPELRRIQRVMGYDAGTGELGLGTYSFTTNKKYALSAGQLSQSYGFRRLDASNYRQVVEPFVNIISLVSPDEGQAFQDSVENMRNVLIQQPVLKFKGSDGNFVEQTLQNYGYSRIQQIARAFDEISYFIPANPLLWFGPFRDMVGLESLRQYGDEGKVLEDKSLRGLIQPGFQGLNNMQMQLMRQLKQAASKGFVNQVKESLEVATLSRDLNRIQQKTVRMSKTILEQQAGRAIEILRGLEEDPSKFRNLTQALYGDKGLLAQTARDLIGKPQIQTLMEQYGQKDIELTRRLKGMSGPKVLVENGITGHSALRRNLAAAGAFLIMDRVVDAFVIQSSGQSLVTQLLGDLFGLKDDDGDRLRNITYTAAVPAYLKYPTAAIGAYLGGRMLPSLREVRSLSGELGAGAEGVFRQYRNYAGRTSVSSVFSPVSKEMVQQADQPLLRILKRGSTRIAPEFGAFGAFFGAVAATLGLQVAFFGASALANMFRDRPDGWLPNRPEAVAATASANITASIREEMNRQGGTVQNLTFNQIGILKAAYSAAQTLNANQYSGKVQYNYSAQITSPIFQFVLQSKYDPQGNGISYGAGFQFFPILGAGASPEFPISLRMKPWIGRSAVESSLDRIYDFSFRTTADRLEDAPTLNEIDLGWRYNSAKSLFYWLNMGLLGGSTIFTANSNTQFHQVAMTLGTATLGAEALRWATAGMQDSSFIRREAANAQTLTAATRFIGRSTGKLLAYSQAPLLLMPNALMKGAGAFFGAEGEMSDFLSKSLRLRSLMPFGLALMTSSALMAPGGSAESVGLRQPFDNTDPVGAVIKINSYRFGTAVLAGGIYGTAMYRAGIFSRANSFESVKPGGFYIQRKQRQIYEIYQRELQKQYFNEADKILREGEALKQPAQETQRILRRELKTLAKAHRYELPLIHTAALRFKMFSYQMALTSAAIAGIGLALAPTGRNALNETLGGLFELVGGIGTPASRNDLAYEKQLSLQPLQYRPTNLTEAAQNFGDYLARPLLNLFGIAPATGIYVDQMKMFLNVAGPFGVTDSGNYTQAETELQDLSGSSIVMAPRMQDPDLLRALQAVLLNPTGDIFTKMARFRGAAPRADRMKVAGGLTDSEIQTSRTSEGLAMALERRNFLAEWTTYQRPRELYYDLTVSLGSTQPGMYNPFLSLGRFEPLTVLFGTHLNVMNNTRVSQQYLESMRVFGAPNLISMQKVGAGQAFLSGLNQVLTGSTASVDDMTAFLSGLPPRPAPMPLIGTAVDNFRTGGVNAAIIALNNEIDPVPTFFFWPSIVLMAQSAALGAATLISTVGFGSQIAAALSAYRQGGVVSELNQQLQEKLTSITFRSRSRPLGYMTQGDEGLVLTRTEAANGRAYKLLASRKPIEGLGETVVTQKVKYANKYYQRFAQMLESEILSLGSTTTGGAFGVLGQHLDVGSRTINTVKVSEDLLSLFADRLLAQEIGQGSGVYMHHTYNLAPQDKDDVRRLLQQSGIFEPLERELSAFMGTKGQVKDPEIWLGRIKVTLASHVLNLMDYLETQGAATVTDIQAAKAAGFGTVKEHRSFLRSQIITRRSATSLIIDPEVRTLAQRIDLVGYSGTLKEVAGGLVKVAGTLMNLAPILSIGYGVTGLASSDLFERRRAAYMVAVTSVQAPAIAVGLKLFGVAMANPLAALTIGGVLVGGYLLDRNFNKGRVLSGLATVASQVDRYLYRPAIQSLTDLYMGLTTAPGIGSVARAVLGVAAIPFNILEGPINSVYTATKNAGLLGELTSMFLPETVDAFYQYREGTRPYGINFQGRRQEFYTRAEEREFQVARNSNLRMAALNPQASLLSDLIHPSLVGRSSGTPEGFLSERYFTPTVPGVERIFQDYAPRTALSPALRLALSRRQALGAFHGATFGLKEPKRVAPSFAPASVVSPILKLSKAHYGSYGGVGYAAATKTSFIVNETFILMREASDYAREVRQTWAQSLQSVGETVKSFVPSRLKTNRLTSRLGSFARNVKQWERWGSIKASVKGSPSFLGRAGVLGTAGYLLGGAVRSLSGGLFSMVLGDRKAKEIDTQYLGYLQTVAGPAGMTLPYFVRSGAQTRLGRRATDWLKRNAGAQTSGFLTLGQRGSQGFGRAVRGGVLGGMAIWAGASILADVLRFGYGATRGLLSGVGVRLDPTGEDFDALEQRVLSPLQRYAPYGGLALGAIAPFVRDTRAGKGLLFGSLRSLGGFGRFTGSRTLYGLVGVGVTYGASKALSFLYNLTPWSRPGTNQQDDFEKYVGGGAAILGGGAAAYRYGSQGWAGFSLLAKDTGRIFRVGKRFSTGNRGFVSSFFRGVKSFITTPLDNLQSFFAQHPQLSLGLEEIKGNFAGFRDFLLPVSVREATLRSYRDVVGRIKSFGPPVSRFLRSVGTAAGNLLPAGLDVGLYLGAAAQMQALTPRSSRQQVEVAYQDTVGVAANTLIGTGAVALAALGKNTRLGLGVGIVGSLMSRDLSDQLGIELANQDYAATPEGKRQLRSRTLAVGQAIAIGSAGYGAFELFRRSRWAPRVSVPGFFSQGARGLLSIAPAALGVITMVRSMERHQRSFYRDYSTESLRQVMEQDTNTVLSQSVMGASLLIPGWGGVASQVGAQLLGDVVADKVVAPIAGTNYIRRLKSSGRYSRDTLLALHDRQVKGRRAGAVLGAATGLGFGILRAVAISGGNPYRLGFNATLGVLVGAQTGQGIGYVAASDLSVGDDRKRYGVGSDALFRALMAPGILQRLQDLDNQSPYYNLDTQTVMMSPKDVKAFRRGGVGALGARGYFDYYHEYTHFLQQQAATGRQPVELLDQNFRSSSAYRTVRDYLTNPALESPLSEANVNAIYRSMVQTSRDSARASQGLTMKRSHKFLIELEANVQALKQTVQQHGTQSVDSLFGRTIVKPPSIRSKDRVLFSSASGKPNSSSRFIPENFGIPEATGLTLEKAKQIDPIILYSRLEDLYSIRERLNKHYAVADRFWSKDKLSREDLLYLKTELRHHRGILRSQLATLSVDELYALPSKPASQTIVSTPLDVMEPSVPKQSAVLTRPAYSTPQLRIKSAESVRPIRALPTKPPNIPEISPVRLLAPAKDLTSESIVRPVSIPEQPVQPLDAEPRVQAFQGSRLRALWLQSSFVVLNVMGAVQAGYAVSQTYLAKDRREAREAYRNYSSSVLIPMLGGALAKRFGFWSGLGYSLSADYFGSEAVGNVLGDLSQTHSVVGGGLAALGTAAGGYYYAREFSMLLGRGGAFRSFEGAVGSRAAHLFPRVAQSSLATRVTQVAASPWFQGLGNFLGRVNLAAIVYESTKGGSADQEVLRSRKPTVGPEVFDFGVGWLAKQFESGFKALGNFFMPKAQASTVEEAKAQLARYRLQQLKAAEGLYQNISPDAAALEAGREFDLKTEALKEEPWWAKVYDFAANLIGGAARGIGSFLNRAYGVVEDGVSRLFRFGQRILERGLRNIRGAFSGSSPNTLEVVPNEIPKSRGQLFLESLYPGSDFSNKFNSGGISGGVFRSGLYAAPQAYNGGSAEYHTDMMFAHNLPMARRVELMDAMSRGYAQDNRNIVFTNAAVSGMVYTHKASYQEKVSIITAAQNAHAVRGRPAMDFYAPKGSFDPRHSSVEGMEKLAPVVPGGRVEYYRAAGRAGNMMRVYDAQGNFVYEVMHGDTRRAVPSNRTFSPNALSGTPGAQEVRQGFRTQRVQYGQRLNPYGPAGRGQQLSAEDSTLLKRLMLAEAGGPGGGGQTGMAMVALSVMNRSALVRSGKTGSGTYGAASGSIRDIVYAPKQYSAMDDGNFERLGVRASSADIARAASALSLAQNPEALRAALKREGRSDAEINQFMSVTAYRRYDIAGDSSFYNVSRAGDHLVQRDFVTRGINVDATRRSLYGSQGSVVKPMGQLDLHFNYSTLTDLINQHNTQRGIKRQYDINKPIDSGNYILDYQSLEKSMVQQDLKSAGVRMPDETRRKIPDILRSDLQKIQDSVVSRGYVLDQSPVARTTQGYAKSPEREKVNTLKSGDMLNGMASGAPRGIGQNYIRVTRVDGQMQAQLVNAKGAVVDRVALMSGQNPAAPDFATVAQTRQNLSRYRDTAPIPQGVYRLGPAVQIPNSDKIYPLTGPRFLQIEGDAGGRTEFGFHADFDRDKKTHGCLATIDLEHYRKVEAWKTQMGATKLVVDWGLPNDPYVQQYRGEASKPARTPLRVPSLPPVRVPQTLPPAPPNQAAITQAPPKQAMVTPEQSSVIIAAKGGAEPHQIRKVTQAYQEGAESLRDVRVRAAKVAQKPKVVKVVGKPQGVAPKPVVKEADPQNRAGQIQPVETVASVQKSGGKVEVLISTTQDLATQQYVAFGDVQNPEFALLEPMRSSSSHRATADAFGMVPDWVSSRYA